MTDFVTAFKSTIDKIGKDLADAKGLPFIDMDDITKSSELLHSSRDALVWEFLVFDPAPVDPLYSFVFRIGSRAVKVAANYTSLGLLDALQKVFPISSRHEIRNMSGAVAGPVVGIIHITDLRIDPQQHDKDSAIRMISITGKCVKEG